MVDELKHYYRVKLALVRVRCSFLIKPPKDDYEAYARKVIERACFLVQNKIDDFAGPNERLMEYYRKSIGKCDITNSERR